MEELFKDLTAHGYLAVFLLMVLDNVGVPFIPSEVPLLFGGYLVSTGDVSFIPMVIVATAGSVLGSLLAYWIGLGVGRKVLERFGRFVLLQGEDLSRAEAWFARRGQAAVFFARMVPLARTIVSVPAGIARMPLGRFTAYTTAGAGLWVIALTAAGWALGENWEKLLGSFTYIGLAVALALLFWGGLWYARRRIERGAAQRDA